jgi:hypothetical protein
MHSISMMGRISVVLTAITGCGGNPADPSPPITPTPSVPSPPPVAEAFHVTGTAMDGEGRPVPGAMVTLQLVSGPRLSTNTNAAGFYEFSFETTRTGPRKYVGGVTGERDGYEKDVRGLGEPSTPEVAQSLRLHRIRRIAPGESLALMVLPDDPGCGDEWEWVCRIVRIVPSASGTLSLSVSPDAAPLRMGLQVHIAGAMASSPLCCSPTATLKVVGGQEVIATMLLVSRI